MCRIYFKSVSKVLCNLFQIEWDPALRPRLLSAMFSGAIVQKAGQTAWNGLKHHQHHVFINLFVDLASHMNSRPWTHTLFSYLLHAFQVFCARLLLAIEIGTLCAQSKTERNFVYGISFVRWCKYGAKTPPASWNKQNAKQWYSSEIEVIEEVKFAIATLHTTAGFIKPEIWADAKPPKVKQDPIAIPK